MSRAAAFRLIAFVAAVSAATGVLADDEPVTQDGYGRLHGPVKRVTKPLIEHARPALGSIRQVCVTPDAKKIVVHEWRRDLTKKRDGVVVLDLGTGDVERVVAESPVEYPGRGMRISNDGKTVVLLDQKNGPPARYEIASGKMVKRFDAVEGKQIAGVWHASDGSRMSIVTRDPGAVVWDEDSGKAEVLELGFVPAKRQFMALPLTDRKTLLVGLMKGRKDDQKPKILLYEPQSKTTSTLMEPSGDFAVVQGGDGNACFIMLQEDPNKNAWTSLERWDWVAKKRLSRMVLKPALTCAGAQFSRDGRAMFMFEFMLQPVVIWTVPEGKLAAVVSPDDGGCESFDVTPDGKKVVAFVGTWSDGTLQPKSLAIYDTSEFAGTTRK